MSVQRHTLTPALGNLQFENVDYSPIERAGEAIARGIEKRQQNKKDAYAQDRLDMMALADHMDGVQGADIEAQYKSTLAGAEKLKSALGKYGRNSPEYLSIFSNLQISLAKDQQAYKNWDKITQQFLAITKAPPNNLDMVASTKKFTEEGKRPIGERNADFTNQMAADPELFRWSGSIIDSLNERANPQKFTYNVVTKEGAREGVTLMTQEYNAATQKIDPVTHKVLSNISDEMYLNTYLKNPKVFDNVIYQKYPEIKDTIAEGFTGQGGTEKFEKFKELVNHIQPDAVAATAGELKWRTEAANYYTSPSFVNATNKTAAETKREDDSIALNLALFDMKQASAQAIADGLGWNKGTWNEAKNGYDVVGKSGDKRAKDFIPVGNAAVNKLNAAKMYQNSKTKGSPNDESSNITTGTPAGTTPNYGTMKPVKN